MYTVKQLIPFAEHNLVGFFFITVAAINTSLGLIALMFACLPSDVFISSTLYLKSPYFSLHYNDWSSQNKN